MRKNSRLSNSEDLRQFHLNFTSDILHAHSNHKLLQAEHAGRRAAVTETSIVVVLLVALSSSSFMNLLQGVCQRRT